MREAKTSRSCTYPIRTHTSSCWDSDDWACACNVIYPFCCSSAVRHPSANTLLGNSRKGIYVRYIHQRLHHVILCIYIRVESVDGLDVVMCVWHHALRENTASIYSAIYIIMLYIPYTGSYFMRSSVHTMLTLHI
jgi:hypothetical protein